VVSEYVANIGISTHSVHLEQAPKNSGAGGPPFTAFSFPITNRGCPILAFFAEPALSGVEGVGGDAADTLSLSCLAACIVTMARIICTLSPVHAIGGSPFFAQRGAAIASSPCWNRLASATVSWSWDMSLCRNIFTY